MISGACFSVCNQPMELNLRRFDPSTIPDNSVCLFIGRRGSGKSTALKDILYYKRNIPSGIVFSATEEANNFFSACIPKSFIYTKFEPDKLEKLIKRQKALYKEGKKTPTFVILDDLMYDNKAIKNCEAIRELFMNGRHYGILTMVTMQYALDITPALRGNTDFVFCAREPIHKTREKLFEHFFGMFRDKNQFEQVFEQCTGNYEQLVCNNKAVSNDIEDCVFWWKARERQPFRVGSKAFWTYHLINYDPDAAPEDDAALSVVKRGVRTLVKKVA